MSISSYRQILIQCPFDDYTILKRTRTFDALNTITPIKMPELVSQPSIENELPVVEEDELTDNSEFEQLYLIEKMLGETTPLKTVKVKSAMEWKVAREVRE